MFKQLKEHFDCGAAGINVVCGNCNKVNFISASATSTKIVCERCGKAIELSEHNQAYLFAMKALLKKMG